MTSNIYKGDTQNDNLESYLRAEKNLVKNGCPDEKFILERMYGFPKEVLKKGFVCLDCE